VSGAQRIAVSGATGLVGSALVPALEAAGQRVLRLVRHAPRGPDEVHWDPTQGGSDLSALAGCAAAVHLAGEPIDQRWTRASRQRIEHSRVHGTTLIAQALAAAAPRPRVLVAASAVGFYGDRGEERLDESSPPGTGFLPRVVQEWEAATAPASGAGIRVVCARFGIVLSPRGGALARMLAPFRWGVGGTIGRPGAWWSWIGVHDLVGVLVRALEDEAFAGAVNAVTPEPARAGEFARTLGRVLGRPAWLPVPAMALTLALGDMARETVLASQRVHPARLAAAGHRFATPDLEGALRHLLGR
jgi:uncharacterized protein